MKKRITVKDHLGNILFSEEVEEGACVSTEDALRLHSYEVVVKASGKTTVCVTAFNEHEAGEKAMSMLCGDDFNLDFEVWNCEEVN